MLFEVKALVDAREKAFGLVRQVGSFLWVTTYEAVWHNRRILMLRPKFARCFRVSRTCKLLLVEVTWLHFTWMEKLQWLGRQMLGML